MTNRKTTRARNANVNANEPVELHDAHVQTRDAQPVKTDVVVSLKNIITTHQIKSDPKLIRRVLRKYYAQPINHQHRDAWMFPESHVPNVIALIDKHCRAGKSSTN